MYTNATAYTLGHTGMYWSLWHSKVFLGLLDCSLHLLIHTDWPDPQKQVAWLRCQNILPFWASSSGFRGSCQGVPTTSRSNSVKDTGCNGLIAEFCTIWEATAAETEPCRSWADQLLAICCRAIPMTDVAYLCDVVWVNQHPSQLTCSILTPGGPTTPMFPGSPHSSLASI